MMKDRICPILIVAVGSALFLAFTYINPYNGEIVLSEFVLQLSGSRGEFALGFSLQELLSLFIRMIPSFIFEAYLGIELYHHFCIASVYVFSRYSKRLRWYWKKIFIIGINVCIFQMVLIITIIVITIFRYRLRIDNAGLILLAYHFGIHVLWIYAITVLINLLAIYWGSSLSFIISIGIQSVFITLLRYEETIEGYLKTGFYSSGFLLKMNPIAHLIIGWHNSKSESVNKALHASCQMMNLNDSLLFYLVVLIIILLIGACVVKKRDLLVSDLEKEGT